MRHTGIDEAGYGPTLGPLAIVRASAACDDPAQLDALRRLGAADSKELHDPKDLAPLEAVALAAIAWLTGFHSDTAADVFALLGEDEQVRAAIPWMQGAHELRLPLAATSVPDWSIAGVQPRGMSGALVQPAAYNAALRSGLNKAELEWREIARLLTEAHRCGEPQSTVVDRLGGRKFYQEVLQRAFPERLVLVVDEQPAASRYRLSSAGGDDEEIGFFVGGESVSPLTAVASCIAKYARELHLHLLNRHWCGRMPWLKPTAGYPQDAKRWLHQLGTGFTGAWGPELVRGVLAAAPDDHAASSTSGPTN